MDRAAQVDYAVERVPVIEAPLKAGDPLGEIRFFDKQGELKKVRLLAASDVPAGNILKRAMDSIALFFLRLFRGV
jgi:D-alanyl-D-alanine carboxypeptidase